MVTQWLLESGVGMRLTKRLIDAAQYEGGTDYRWDDGLPSFGIRVYPSGRKSFVVAYRVMGRKRIMVLGRYGVLTLDQARRRARKVLAEASDGNDPSRDRQALRDAPTVADLAKRFLTDHAPKKKSSSIRDDRRMWKLHILTRLGRRKVSDITRDDIDRLHSRMRETPYAANRVLALLSKAFNLAEVWGWRPDASNPCRHVKPYKEEKRERYLSAAELTRLGAVLDAIEHERVELPGVATAIRLLLLTGCRLNEILSLRWTDVDFERGCLYLADSKTGKRSVLLNRGAIRMLSCAERIAGNPFVIPGKRQGRHLVNLSKPWRRIRERAGIPDVRLHDLRHTFGSFGAGAGLSLPLIGKMLGHSQPATTARYAHLASDPLRQAVNLVGEEIETALSGS